jgi:hypothetical protein
MKREKKKEFFNDAWKTEPQKTIPHYNPEGIIRYKSCKIFVLIKAYSSKKSPDHPKLI